MFEQRSELPGDFIWDVKMPGDATKIGRNPRFGNISRDPSKKIGNKEIWWTKDTAGHGGSKYKLYVEGKTKFNWIADVDANGKVMDNNKGGKELKIEKSHVSWKGGKQ